MKPNIKLKGITGQWIRSIVILSVGIILLIEVVICSFINGMIDSSTINAASTYVMDFEKLSVSSAEEFEKSAVALCENFSYGKKVEVQIITNTGYPLISTSGYINYNQINSAKDYNIAVTNSLDRVTLKLKNSQKESVLATTKIVRNSEGEMVGAYRFIVSLTEINGYRNFLVWSVIAFGVVIFVLTTVAGLYFIGKIVNPLSEITNAARKIASGNFEEKLELPKYNNEISELSDAINFMASELSNSENMKNDFISSVSHELRTPLTAIKGWGETAKISIGQDNDIVEKGMDIILKETERLSELVEELLDFSRMQSGRMTLNIKKTEIGKILEEVFQMYAELSSQQQIKLTYVKPEEPVFVMADKNRIKQVFINVVDNAIKYSEKGGQVLVSTQTEENCIRIIVSDTGVGISAEDIEHVKEKFYKANKIVRGSGIGLAVADEIVKQHNGLLFLESSEGVGTSVTIVLPLIEEKTELTAVYFSPNSDGEEVDSVENIEEIVSSEPNLQENTKENE